MTFESMLAARKAELSEKWADLVLKTYPKETQKVWSRQKDRFQNPVGAAIIEATGELIDHLIEWQDAGRIAVSLDRLIRIRAVQDFTPSQAISFVYLLKKLLRDEFFRPMKKNGTLDELLKFEAKVDNLAMMSFDIYCKSREEVFRFRVEEVKRTQSSLLRKAGLVADVTVDKSTD
ncbi:RsbRD N-terminal domain-containing protein [Pseudodesulfovibrio thermohalotolerans]|uniref:RsbRD N-terminal domain-containing protein n=1 Tax=Pseudodesulfovibrio thermohalotolerans TaxID=2880651 RepID=UPI002441C29D|nr:RsbRD N-terminal domain-containing protein [Pseudodesulfovibrio thermohalotolerans]WFS62980.1 RsbRD N-terminal domain-containing protein [Pseudodesulfovibrio thermohalotolerans]